MFRGPVRSLVAVLATVALLGAGCGWVGAEQEPLEPLVIGVDLQLSGVGGPVDRVLEHGLELRAEQINARGLYGSRPVELTISDNAGDPARSRQNVAALAADPAVSAVITGSCERCWAEAAGPAMTAGVVVMSLAAHDVLELVEERRWVFRVGPNAADGADVLALELANAQVQTAGLLATDDAHGQSGADELTDALGVHGIELVTTARLPADGDEQSAGEAVTQIAEWWPEPDPFTPPVDNDPLVMAYARALLVGDPLGVTDHIEADVRDFDTMMTHTARTFDFHEPIAVIMSGILSHIVDNNEAQSLICRIVSALPAGSHLVISDHTNVNGSRQAEAEKIWNQRAQPPCRLRTPDQIAGFFNGLELVEPGVVPATRWRPDHTTTQPPGELGNLVGLARTAGLPTLPTGAGARGCTSTKDTRMTGAPTMNPPDRTRPRPPDQQCHLSRTTTEEAEGATDEPRPHHG